MPRPIPYKFVRNAVTDLKARSFVSVDLTHRHDEKNTIRAWSDRSKSLFDIARKKGLSQFHVLFPTSWNSFSSILLRNDFKAGLFVVEKVMKKDADQVLSPVERLEDISSFQKLLHEQQMFHYGLDPDFFAHPDDFCFHDYLNELKELHRSGDGAFFGIFERNELTGFIGLERDKNGYYINELIVQNQHRGKGLGKLLMQAAFSHAAQNGQNRIRTTLSANNASALGFYESCGFQRQAQKYYSDVHF